MPLRSALNVVAGIVCDPFLRQILVRLIREVDAKAFANDLQSLSRPLYLPVGAVVPVGKGRLIVLGLADGFQDMAMGSTRVLPSKKDLELYEFEYALLRTLTELDGGERVKVP